MATEATVGINSYVTRAETDAYHEDSARGAAWITFGPDDKNRALLSATRKFETVVWEGLMNSLDIVDTVTINVAGTGYVANDIVTLVGGTGLLLRLTVLTVGGSGEVQTFRILDAGLYSVQPSGSGDATTGGTGSGFTLDTTYKVQVLEWARTGVDDQYENVVTSTDYPQDLKNGLMEYALDVALDPSLLESGGRGDNIKSAGAGSAKVEFFRPTGGADGTESVQFAPHIMDWIGPFMAGANLTPPSVFGTDGTSSFDDCDNAGLTEGLK